MVYYYWFRNAEQYVTNPDDFMRRLTSSNLNDFPIPNNVLNPTARIWEAPNMVNFPQFIDNLQTITKRRPKWFPNEETFSSSNNFNNKMIEGYRPGDWRINGYVAAQALERLQKK